MGLLCPVLRASGTLVRSLFGIFRQSLRGCLINRQDEAVTYAPSYENYEKEQVPNRSIRYRMGVPQSSPSSPREAKSGTSKATQPAPDPRRGVLCAKERLPLAAFARRLPTLEDGLPLVQEVAH